MTALEDAHKEMCVCDTSKCDVDELEEVKEVIGFLCCNPDFVSGSSLLANGECNNVDWGDFTEFVMMMKDDDDHDGHDHDHHDDDMGSGYGYGYGFVEEECVDDDAAAIAAAKAMYDYDISGCSDIAAMGFCTESFGALTAQEGCSCSCRTDSVRDIKPECEGACPAGVCDNADDADTKHECAECKACHEPAPERPHMDRGDMPHYHDGGMEHSHPGGDMPHDHEDHGDHGEECGPPMKHKDMKKHTKMMCSPCMGLMDDMGKEMDKEDSKMEEVCAAGGPIDKFKKGCPAEDFKMIMEMMEGGDDHDDDRRRLDGPPECVSACDGDICCDAGICSDCSTSSCSQDDMAMIVGECARQNAQGSGGGSGSGSGGMMMMPKTKAEIDGLYACMCATSSMEEKGDDYKPTCADVADLQAALTASDCTDEGLKMIMGPDAPPVAEFAKVMGEMVGLTDC